MESKANKWLAILDEVKTGILSLEKGNFITEIV
jgi:hypothetical protein